MNKNKEISALVLEARGILFSEAGKVSASTKVLLVLDKIFSLVNEGVVPQEENNNILKGRFESIWEEGRVSTPATLNLDTMEVMAKIEGDCEDMGCLLSEKFVSSDGGAIYTICPHCHQYALRTVSIKTDSQRRIISQELECPQCK